MIIKRTQNAVRNMISGAVLKLYQILCPFIIRTVFIYTLGMKYLGLNSLFTSILQVLNIAELGNKTITYIDLFWVAGLIAKHGELRENEALDLRQEYENEGGDVMEVITFLINEYTNFLDALTDTGSKKKKAKIVKG